ncbi:Cyclic AMP-responsive element-binding protein 3-like protein 4, partial [Clarias magur]
YIRRRWLMTSLSGRKRPCGRSGRCRCGETVRKPGVESGAARDQDTRRTRARAQPSIYET